MTPDGHPAITEEHVLEHASFVRRVARAIVRDDHLADDVTQETLTRAVARPPSQPRALRSWLGRVARNLALNTLRREGRTARREQAAARPEHVESAASQVEREAMLRSVVDAVLSLDEPYKSAVMMRYFEGLPAPDIAERAGVSPSAVRSRLSRALELLRQRLDAAHGDDRERWGAVLLLTVGGSLPRLGPVGDVRPVRPGPGEVLRELSRAGRTWMTTGAKVGIAATAGVALLVGAVVLLWNDPYEVEESGGARGVATSSLVPGRASREAGSIESRRNGTPAVEDSSATAAAPRASISGEVRHLDGGAPAAGIDVRLFGPGGDVPLACVQTTESGVFRIPADDAGGPYSVEVANEGGPPPRAAGLRLLPEEQLFVGTLWLGPPLGVDALVVDESGQPVPGALVEAFLDRPSAGARDLGPAPPPAETTAETAADGRAALVALTPGTWTLRATHEGFAPGGVAGVDVRAPRSGDPVRVVLERGAPVGGVVTHADGSPAEGVTIVAVAPRDGDRAMTPPVREVLRAEALTDAGGAYRFPALARGTHSIGVAAAQGSVARVWVIDVPSVERFDIVLCDAGIQGVVTDADTGRPLAGAVVHAAAWRAHHPTHYSATTDDAGRYRIPFAIQSMVQGPARAGGGGELGVHFRAEKPGWVMVEEGVDTAAEGAWVAGDGFADWNVRMRRAASLEGVVAGPDGPVPGAQVTADVWNDLLGSVRTTTFSGADGRYVFPGLHAGRAIVSAEKSGWSQQPAPARSWAAPEPPDPACVVDVPESGVVQLDVSLVRGRVVLGRVVSTGGAPVPEARVVASGEARAAATTDAEGRFRVSGLPNGQELELQVSRRGFGTARATVPADEDDGAPLEITLGDTAIVGGRVAGAAGGPAAGAYVQVAQADELESGSYVLVGIWQRAEKHPVAEDGSFEVAVPVGADGTAVRVRAAAPGHAPALSGRIELTPGARVIGVPLQLGAGHVLAGRVIAADGSGGVGGASVEFVNARLPLEICEQRGDMFNPGGRPFEIVAVTAADGSFRVAGLPEWNYELRVIADGYLWAHATARVPGSEEMTIELATGGAIAGRLQFDDGTPAGAVSVFALDGAGRRVTQTRTAPDGTFRLEGLRDDAHALQIEAAPYGGADVLPQTFDAVDVGRTDVQLVAQHGAGAISGVCLAPGGAPAAGVYVSAKPMAGGTVVRTRTDTSGAFVLRGLTDAPQALVAVCTRPTGGPETIGQRCSLERLDVAVGTSGLTLEMIPTLTWTGQAVREDGAPLPHGTIIALREAPASPWQHIGRLEPDGSFSFATVRGVPYLVELTDPSTGQPLEIAGGPTITPSSAPARLVVPRGGSVAGVVVASDGRPVPHAVVVARLADGTERRAATDVEGRFQVTGLPAGGTVDVEAASHEHGRAASSGVRAGDTGVRLTLRAADVLALRVIDARGEPVRGEVLEIRRVDDVVALLRTDAEGRASSAALAAGTYVVACRESGTVLGPAATGGGETTLRRE